MFQVNDLVQFAGITHDDRDRLIAEPPTALRVLRVNPDCTNPDRSWDYQVESGNSGNRFYVYSAEIEAYQPFRQIDPEEVYQIEGFEVGPDEIELTVYAVSGKQTLVLSEEEAKTALGRFHLGAGSSGGRSMTE